MMTCMVGIVSKRIVNCIHHHEFHQQMLKCDYITDFSHFPIQFTTGHFSNHLLHITVKYAIEVSCRVAYTK